MSAPEAAAAALPVEEPAKRKREDDPPAEAPAAGPSGDAAADEPAGKKAREEPVVYEPCTLGPKVFESPESMYRYFGGLLNSCTPDQDLNEVRGGAQGGHQGRR